MQTHFSCIMGKDSKRLFSLQDGNSLTIVIYLYLIKIYYLSKFG